MKTITKVFGAIIGGLTLAFQVPAVQTAVGGFLGAHQNVSAVLAGLLGIAALFHSPTATPSAPAPTASK